jgi:hypothetical protein
MKARFQLLFPQAVVPEMMSVLFFGIEHRNAVQTGSFVHCGDL